MAEVATTAGQTPADATSWMDNPENWSNDSKATQEAYSNIPVDDGTPRPPKADAEPQAEALTELQPGEQSARERLEADLAAKDAAKAEAAPAAPSYTQDENGKWHRPDGGFADATEVEALDELMREGAVSATNAGTPAAAAPATPAKPKFHIAVYDKDGKELPDLPEIAVSFKVDGKVVEKMPLERLVRSAQYGHYNEQREQAVLASQQKIEAATTRADALEKDNQALNQFFERVMVDNDFLTRTREEYARANSPEAQLATREQRLQQQEQAQKTAAVRAQAEVFVKNEISPRLAAIETQYKDVISPEALYGKFAMLTQHLTVNGVIPPNRHPEVVRILDTVIGPWAEDQSQSRKTTETAATESARKQVEEAKVLLALAKRERARKLQPQGRPGALREPPKPQPPPKSAEEANDRFIQGLERGEAA